MRHMKIAGLLIAALGVLAAFGAGPAFAASTNNPTWAIEGTQLVGSESVSGSSSTVQILKTASLEIKCTGLTTTGASIIGSTLPAAGTDKGKIVYSGCTVGGTGHEKCKINGAIPGTITTQELVSKLVYLTKVAATEEKLATEETGTLFAPESTTAKLFAEFELAETEAGKKQCPVTGKVKVTGTGVVTKNLGKNENIAEHKVEAPATAQTVYFENVGGVTKEVTGIKIEANSEKATYTGTAGFKLSGANSGKNWNAII